MKKEQLNPLIQRAMNEFLSEVNPHNTMASLLEVMRQMGQSEMMRESDPAADQIWGNLYYLIRLLRAMQKVDLVDKKMELVRLQREVEKRTKKKGA